MKKQDLKVKTKKLTESECERKDMMLSFGACGPIFYNPFIISNPIR